MKIRHPCLFPVWFSRFHCSHGHTELSAMLVRQLAPQRRRRHHPLCALRIVAARNKLGIHQALAGRALLWSMRNI
jgi:hypothetical protein